MNQKNKNTSLLWDKVWDAVDFSQKQDVSLLQDESKRLRWKRIEKVVIKNFESFEGLKVIEIGAGSGSNAALMAKKGAFVTILDYSEKALERSKKFFENNSLSAEFILLDAFDLPQEHFEQYDIAMSFGLAEHFIGDKRFAINKVHFDLLKEKGIAFISVPNRWNFPYRIAKFILEKLRMWKVGEEYPYSCIEFSKICNTLNFYHYWFLGGSALSSLRFINIFKFVRKFLHLKEPQKNIVFEIPTIFDKYFSYSLVLCLKK